MNSGNCSYDDPMSTEMVEYICDGSQSHPNFNRRETRYKIRDRIRQIQQEWKVELKDTQNMGKGLHKVFKTVIKDIPKIYCLWDNLVQKFPISFQNLETFLK